jgi:hypothetical protein
MVQSQARVVTDQPGRYVKQLVSHLGQKWSTEMLDDRTGVIAGPSGRCTLRPDGAAIVLAATAADAESLQRVRDVVTRHLERFGRREGLLVSWSEPT